MTGNEAIERAAAIWGRRRVSCVRSRYDGGYDIQLLPAGIASDVRDHNYVCHTVDANGHAVCHDDCKQLEDALR